MEKMPFLFPPLFPCLPSVDPSLSSFLLFTQVLPYQSVIAQLEGDEEELVGRNPVLHFVYVCPNYCVGKHLRTGTI